jgi:hypothetical protein
MAPVGMQNASFYSRQQLDDALASTKMEGASKLVVRNTFFDVEDDREVPAMPQLLRAKTAPAHAVRDDMDSDSEWEKQGIDSDSELEGERISRSTSSRIDQGYCASDEAVYPYTEDDCLSLGGILQPVETEHDVHASIYAASGPGSLHLVQYSPCEGVDMGWINNNQLVMMSECEPQTFHFDATIPEFIPQSLQPTSEWELLEAKGQAFQPQSLCQYRSYQTGATCIWWTVDACKLRGSHRGTVSPPFKIFGMQEDASPCPFKMSISPKGSTSFGKAGGKGIVQLKCEAPPKEPESRLITFSLSAGTGQYGDCLQLPPCGPVTHNFSLSNMKGLPKDSDTWDFLNLVDESSQTFVICLVALPAQS